MSVGQVGGGLTAASLPAPRGVPWLPAALVYPVPSVELTRPGEEALLRVDPPPAGMGEEGPWGQLAAVPHRRLCFSCPSERRAQLPQTPSSKF